ncbi:MAG: hypothetical protein KF777_11875 [Planctomycetaceae bacterium]|nr:hypothetical protein [Planctomycetaceae bacterium]
MNKIVFTREIDGRVERVEWFREADLAWLVVDGVETILEPEIWQQTWVDLEARGFIEVFPADRRKLNLQKARVLELIRNAFEGVTLGDGIGLRQGQGLDKYAGPETLAKLRADDEKQDWTAIPVEELDRCCTSLSYFDAEGMRFHLPAFMVAELEGRITSSDVVFILTYQDDGMMSRFDGLSPAQREAVREYLLLQLSDPHREFQHPMIEAGLKEYWGS